MPATRTRVVVTRGYVQTLSHTPEVEHVLHAKAKAVARHAQARAPRYTGRYAASFVVRFATTAAGRRVVRVHNTAPYALFVEYGGRNTPRWRVLGTALDAARHA